MRKAFHTWVLEHDQNWSFIIPYVILAVVLSIWISLFWLVVVVGIHALFEWVRQKHHRPNARIYHHVLWEIKLDIALVIFALQLGVYMEFVLGVLGLGSAARAGIQSGARFAGFEHALRGILISVDDAAHVVRGAVNKFGGGGVEEEGEELVDIGGYPHGEKWGKGDWASITFGTICLVLIFVAPLLIETTYPQVVASILSELHPWP